MNRSDETKQLELLPKVVIYTDGACSGNPGSGGWAAILRYTDVEKKLLGIEENTTNNRMELMAAISALEALRHPCLVEMYTDSTYVKNGITQWVGRWLKNNWLNSAKQSVKNQDLWQRLLVAAEPHQISWYWVKGHSGDKLNDRVDKLARSGNSSRSKGQDCK
ncbi:MAG: ribonuclease HI [Holosporaceae bacterium]|jgi:ribonuclease HI|nr:ribonuclease HI [Holosporaceae bacterium]